MFGSKKSKESQYLKNLTLSDVNDSYNNAVPKTTSTPLHVNSALAQRRNSPVISPNKSHHGGLRRYSLSDMNSPTNKSTLNRSQLVQGPLLASLSFKDNVSMYEETRSSGLAERIVSYNKETERDLEPTHQEKYNGPGLFPIVHLFKEKQPLLQQTLNRVKIKLSNSDYFKHSPVQCNSRLQDGLTKSRLQNRNNVSHSQSTSESGTKSVLDVLKEISRKRIHSIEDYDLNEDSGKRLRTEYHNGTTPNAKRGRPDSPNSETSQEISPKQTQKKICVYDEYAASKSSTDFSFLKKTEPTLAKRKTISTSTENLKEPKQIKLVNVETQTISIPEENKVKETESSKEDEADIVPTTSKDAAVKIFNDTPLEKIRKDRLAALMGNLAGKQANINISPREQQEESKDVVDSKNVKEPTVANSILKPIISIMPPPITTSEKHVHFNLPSLPSSSVAPVTQSSTSITTPISSISENKTAEAPKLPTFTASPSPSMPVSMPAAQFSFGNMKPAVSTLEVSTKLETTLFQNTPTSGALKENSPTKASTTSNTSSPTKAGGFKFALNSPSKSNAVSTTIVSSNPATLSFPQLPLTNSPRTETSGAKSNVTFSFGKPEGLKTSMTTPSTSASTFPFGKPAETKQNNMPSTISFPVSSTEPKTSEAKSTAAPFAFHPIEAKTQANFSFGSANTPAVSSTSTTPFNYQVTKSPTFNFAGASKPVSELKPVDNSQAPSTGFSFGAKTDVKFGAPVPSSQAVALAFGAPATTSMSTFAFPTSTSIAPSLGKAPISKPSFQMSSPSLTFGKTIAQTTASPTVTTQSTFAFGGNSIAKPTPTSKPFAFSGPTSSAGIFSSAQPQKADVKQTSETPMFGGGTGFKSGASAAGSTFESTPATSAPVFGSTTATPSMFLGSAAPKSTFGNAPASTTSVFGSASSGFGSTIVTSSSTFGTDAKPTFGSSNVFGNANNEPPAFGSATAPVFGSATPSAPTFGSLTPSKTPFGTSTAVAVPAFGSGGSSAFGSVPVTTASSVFNTTSAPSFGFGSKPAFTFGNSNENKSAVNVFGSGAGTSAFGKPAPTQNGFGGADKGFGSSAATFSSTGSGGFATAANSFGSGSSFGAQAPAQSSGGFNFGAPGSTSVPGSFSQSETPKPKFNFTAGAPAPAFGSTNNPVAFGTPTSSFGAPVPTFGAAGPSTSGVFNIGSGTTSSNRNRNQLRAKRRT